MAANAAIVVLNDVRHAVTSPLIPAAIAWLLEHQDVFARESGRLVWNFKGTSLTVEPSYVDHVKVEKPSEA